VIAGEIEDVGLPALGARRAPVSYDDRSHSLAADGRRPGGSSPVRPSSAERVVHALLHPFGYLPVLSLVLHDEFAGRSLSLGYDVDLGGLALGGGRDQADTETPCRRRPP